MQLALLVAHQQDGLAVEVQRPVVACLGELVLPRDHVPLRPQHALQLELMELLVEIAVRRKRDPGVGRMGGSPQPLENRVQTHGYNSW